MDLGARHLALAVVAGFVVWSIYALSVCLAISFVVLMIVIAAGFRLFKSRPAGGMEGAPPTLESTLPPQETDLRMAAAVVIAFLVTAGGLIGVSGRVYYLNSSVDYSYTVTIESSSSDTFTIICPVPCKKDGTVCEEFFEDARIVEGSGSFSKTDTDRGQAIRVWGEGTVRIEWEDSWPIDSTRYPNMTMTWEVEDYYDPQYYDYEVSAESWIYSTSNLTTVRLDYSMWASQDGPGFFDPASGPFYEFEVLTDGRGWETVAVDYCYLCAN